MNFFRSMRFRTIVAILVGLWAFEVLCVVGIHGSPFDWRGIDWLLALMFTVQLSFGVWVQVAVRRKQRQTRDAST